MEASKIEKGGVVCFLAGEEVGGTEIHRRMSQDYGEHCMSLTRVKTWQLVDGLVTKDCRVTVKTVAAEVGLSVGSVHTIMTERLNRRKVCAQWVPHSLQPQQEACRMAHCIDHLQRYARDGNEFLAGDES